MGSLLGLSPRRRRAFVLVGHVVSDPKAFGSYLDQILADGVSFIDLPRLTAAIIDGRPLPGTAAVTFDDAHASVATNAHPELERRGIPYTIFACGERAIGGDAPWFARFEQLAQHTSVGYLASHWEVGSWTAYKSPAVLLSAIKCLPLERILAGLVSAESGLAIDIRARSRAQYLQATDLQELQRSGLVTIGCHTFRHPVLANETRENQFLEIRKGLEALERTLTVERLMAIPDGWRTSYNSETLGAIERAGFAASFTTIERSLRRAEHRFLIPRIGMADPFAPGTLSLKRSLPFLSPRVARHAARVWFWRLRRGREVAATSGSRTSAP